MQPRSICFTCFELWKKKPVNNMKPVITFRADIVFYPYLNEQVLQIKIWAQVKAIWTVQILFCYGVIFQWLVYLKFYLQTRTQ